MLFELLVCKISAQIFEIFSRAIKVSISIETVAKMMKYSKHAFMMRLLCVLMVLVDN